MIDVDFTNARFDGCDFRGVNFDRVILPDDENLMLIGDERLIDKALSLLELYGRESEAPLASAILSQVRKYLNPGVSILLNTRDFESAAPLMVNVLSEAGWRPRPGRTP